jgi:hypothetical protein
MKSFESTDLPALIGKVANWHQDRNLIDGSDDKAQVLKLIQEVGELSDSVCKNLTTIDDIGDIIVILINIAVRNNLTIYECLEYAYNDIKDRKGMMVDGIFVKDGDKLNIDLDSFGNK